MNWKEIRTAIREGSSFVALVATTCVVLWLVSSAHCQTAQDSAFWTKDQVIGQSANFSVRVWDVAQSCAHISPRYREVGGPWQSCLGITAWSGAGIPLSIGMAYAFHKTHHDKLAKWAPWVWSAMSGVGIAVSYHTYSLPQERKRP